MEITDFEQLVDRITTKVMARLKEKKLDDLPCIIGDQKTQLYLECASALRSRLQNNQLDFLVITELSFENLVNSIHFNPQNDLEQAIIQAIKQGQKIIVIKEGRTYLSLLTTGKYALKQKVLELESQFYRYGGEFTSIAAFKQLVSEQKSPPYEKLKNTHYITVKDLQSKNLQPHATLTLSEKTKLTDYAKEYIREKNINISWSNEK